MYQTPRLNGGAGDDVTGLAGGQTLNQVFRAGLARTRCCTPLRMPADFADGVTAHPCAPRPGAEVNFRTLAGLLNRLDQSVSNPALDDALGRGNGPLGALARRLADAFGAVSVRHAPHGSSLANVTLLLALNTLKPGRLKLAVDRSCHKSLVAGLALVDAEIVWIERDTSPVCDIPLPLNAASLRGLLEAHGDLDAVFFTSPTYEGFSCDAPGDIAALFAATGTRLIVDSAWGAFEGLLSGAGFPQPMAPHAAASVVSAHKKGAGLSGSSFVTFNDAPLCRAFERFCDLGLVSTSPNFLSSLVLEHSLEYWASPQGRTCAARLVAESRKFGARLAGIGGVRVVAGRDLGAGIAGDPGHVLVDVAGTGRNGRQVADELAGRHAIDIEMVIGDKILFLFGPDHIGTWPSIVAALQEALARLSPRASPPERVAPSPVAGDWQGMQAAVMRPTRQVLPEHAAGCIAAAPVSAYPPGRPLIHPGECFSRDIVDYIVALEAQGARLTGVMGALNEFGFTVTDETS